MQKYFSKKRKTRALHLFSFKTPIIHNKRIYYLYNRHPIPTLYHI